MIKNDKQYQVTQKKLAEFKSALQNLKENKEISADEIEIRSRFIEPQIEIFQGELDEFEKLKNKNVPWLNIFSLQEISDVLIKARIAKGWTQGDLAAELGIKEQQIQRYESADYETASLARITEVFMALDLKLGNCRVILGEPQWILPENMDATDVSKAFLKLHERALICTENEVECAQ
jgi:HTH-type transcriptional regulator / antitoxin HipB